jgi:exopolysaccharide production negative regulator
MRTSEALFGLVIVGLGLGLWPALGFDGTRQPADVTPTVSVDTTPRVGAPGSPLGLGAVSPETARRLTPSEAYRSGALAIRAGDTAKGITSLEYAAEQGLAAAQWKLARMYADGDGVEQSDLRAYDYFNQIANAHADDAPTTPRGRLVAKAFVALGHYHLEGIPNSSVKPDPERARQLYAYAASYFGDPDAQFNLGRLYLDGNGVQKDPKQAARWLGLAANKGHYQAETLLGAMLFKGQAVPRQAAKGLMWLTLGRDAATNEDSWVNELYDAAFKQATDDERALALVYLEQYLKGSRRQ